MAPGLRKGVGGLGTTTERAALALREEAGTSRLGADREVSEVTGNASQSSPTLVSLDIFQRLPRPQAEAGRGRRRGDGRRIITWENRNNQQLGPGAWGQLCRQVRPVSGGEGEAGTGPAAEGQRAGGRPPLVARLHNHPEVASFFPRLTSPGPY